MANKSKNNNVGEHFLAIPFSVIADNDLNLAEKYVLSLYLSYVRQYGKCDLTYDQMSKQLNMSWSSVSRSMARLIELKKILPVNVTGSSKKSPVKVTGETSQTDRRLPVNVTGKVINVSIDKNPPISEENPTKTTTEFDSLFGGPKNR